MLGSVNFVFAAEEKELTDDEKAAFIVRDEWTGWVKDFTASLSELDQLATAKIYDGMDFYDMQYRFTEKYKKVPEYLDEDGKPTQKLKDMIKEKRKKIAGAKTREFLCFTAKADGVKISLANVEYLGLGGDIGKSSDGVSFTTWDGSVVKLNNGEKLYVWNKNDKLSTQAYGAARFMFGKDEGSVASTVEVSGDLASMINFGDATPYCFYQLFFEATALTSLPEITVANAAEHCFDGTFYGCSNAKTGPSSLPATSVPESAYHGMFENCTKLEKAPTIAAKSLERFACYYMFKNCKALTAAPELPATTLEQGSYAEMFYGCDNLVTAPSTLPALSLPVYAYAKMFSGCAKIVKSPYIKARTLEADSFKQMFSQCTNLAEIHIEDYVGELNTTYSESWVAGVGVDATRKIYYPGPTEDRNISAIPEEWTVVKSN